MVHVSVKTRSYGGIIEHAVVAELFTFYALNHEPRRRATAADAGLLVRYPSSKRRTRGDLADVRAEKS